MPVRLLPAEVDALSVKLASLTGDQYAQVTNDWNARLRRLRAEGVGRVDPVTKFDALRCVVDETTRARR